MLLALDVGNTNLVIGLFEGAELKAPLRMHTDRHRTADEYGVMLKVLLHEEGYRVADLEGVAISNVVPVLGHHLASLCRRHLKCDPFFVDVEKKLAITVKTDNPHQVGADLLVAADEAYSRFGGPLVVIDMGTATTISAINERGEFLGATIGPGLSVSLDAFYARAPHLPRISLEPPPLPWGTNTEHAMQAGILMGHAMMVDGLVGRMKQQLGKARVVATGGLASSLVRQCKEIDEVEPWLVLQGVRRVWERNR